MPVLVPLNECEPVAGLAIHEELRGGVEEEEGEALGRVVGLIGDTNPLVDLETIC